MWAGPDERRLWSASCGGRTGAVFLAMWRWAIGLYFLAFQLWYWNAQVQYCWCIAIDFQDISFLIILSCFSQSDPAFYIAYLTEQTMWLELSYFIIAAVTGSLALASSFSGIAYFPGVPSSLGGDKLENVSWVQRYFWNNTLRAQYTLFAIT